MRGQDPKAQDLDYYPTVEQIFRELTRQAGTKVPISEAAKKVDNICPQMQRLLHAAEEQNQMLGPNMEHIAEMPMAEKMSILSSLTTLTIDI